MGKYVCTHRGNDTTNIESHNVVVGVECLFLSTLVFPGAALVRTESASGLSEREGGSGIADRKARSRMPVMPLPVPRKLLHVALLLRCRARPSSGGSASRSGTS